MMNTQLFVSQPMGAVCARRWWLFVMGLVLAFAFGRPAQAQNADAQPVKYWIFLSDKLDAAGKTLAPEAGYLTDRARQRRQRRGTMPAPSFDAPLSPAYLGALRQQGVEPLVQSRWLNAVSARLTAAQAEAVSALPFVRALRPVGQSLPPPAETAAPAAAPAPLVPIARPQYRLDYGNSQTQLDAINAVPALERGINGAGVRLGIIDTEFGGFSHAVFQQMVGEGRLIADSNFVGQAQSSRHGRSVASVAVGFMEGQLIGPAYGAEVMAATTEFAPSETNQEEDNFVAALEWMEAQGVDVVNVSLGYNEFDPGQNSYTPSDLDGDTGITTRAADRAAMLGVVMVTSAGNEGNRSWRLITTPADGDSVIAVGSVSSSGTKASSSGFGPTADGRIKPDVAAMGVSVYQVNTSGNFGRGSGTSFSSPLVAGVAAQMLQVNGDLTPIEARDILRATASQSANPDNSLGWGIIDADAAIREAERCADPGFACVTPTTVSTEDEAPIPTRFEVLAPYPNPFSTEAVFEVRAPAQAGAVTLSIYNLLGQRVDVPFEGLMNPGLNRIAFRAPSLPAGLYVYRLEGTGVSHTGTMVKVR